MGEILRRFQYTAIDAATCIRAREVYEKHTQGNAIDFVNYVVEKCPFRISKIPTDHGHEFQIKSIGTSRTSISNTSTSKCGAPRQQWESRAFTPH